jgi:hypothetical protein
VTCKYETCAVEVRQLRNSAAPGYSYRLNRDAVLIHRKVVAKCRLVTDYNFITLLVNATSYWLPALDLLP